MGITPHRHVCELIWHLKIHERINVFLWKLSHSRLLINDSCWRRRLSLSPDCLHYARGSEDCLHLLRDCGDAVEVWLQLLPPPVLQKFFTLPLDTYLGNDMQTQSCKALLKRQWVVLVSKIYREANQVADGVANWVLNQALGFHPLSNSPVFLRRILEAAVVELVTQGLVPPLLSNM